MRFHTIKRDEILPMIEQAKNPGEQMEILCDLLECSMEELLVLLEELKKERTIKREKVPALKSGRWDEIELERLKKLHKKGLSSAEIADRLGRKKKAVIHMISVLKQKDVENNVCDKREKRVAAESVPAKELVERVAHDEELSDVAAYAKTLEATLSERDSEIKALQEQIDASAAQSDHYDEKLEEAWKAADEKAKALLFTEEKLKNARELLLKYDRKNTVLSSALAKSLEFIASLNGIISEALKY